MTTTKLWGQGAIFLRTLSFLSGRWSGMVAGLSQPARQTDLDLIARLYSGEPRQTILETAPSGVGAVPLHLDSSLKFASGRWNWWATIVAELPTAAQRLGLGRKVDVTGQLLRPDNRRSGRRCSWRRPVPRGPGDPAPRDRKDRLKREGVGHERAVQKRPVCPSGPCPRWVRC